MQDMFKIKAYVKSILLPVLLGVLMGFIISGSMDYNELQRPLFAPPGWLFPIVWTILYALMGVSFGILKNKELSNSEVDRLYYAQLITNLAWPLFFFVFKWRLFAFFWILFLVVLVIRMIMEFYRKNQVAGLLQIPYLVWLVYATYLNLGVYLLN